MGTLAQLVPILGILAGFIVARLTPYEFKQGEKYFKYLMYALLITVIGIAVWNYVKEQNIQLEVPIFLFFIPFGTLYHRRYLLMVGAAVIYAAIALLLF